MKKVIALLLAVCCMASAAAAWGRVIFSGKQIYSGFGAPAAPEPFFSSMGEITGVYSQIWSCIRTLPHGKL